MPRTRYTRSRLAVTDRDIGGLLRHIADAGHFPEQARRGARRMIRQRAGRSGR